MSRLLLVSNRLPVTVKADDSGPTVTASVGGLATALRKLVEDGSTRWIGWPGSLRGLSETDRERVGEQLKGMGLIPVSLSRQEIKGFYLEYCNGVLWPLSHYLLDQVPLRIESWPHYESANRRFAEAVLAAYQPGDTIWVHDYHLMLLPGMLRRALPDAPIGYFHHIPFPGFEVFRTLPQRSELLDGLLGADLVGFHAASYLRDFSKSALHLLGAQTEMELVRHRGRTTRLGVFPLGIDVGSFEELARRPQVAQEALRLRAANPDRLMVAIDRLDYTKGIPRRLLAFETLLARNPDLLGRVQLLQVAAPSRTDVRAYRRFRAQVDRLVGRINGRFGTASWTPVLYLYRGLSQDTLAGLYRAADVMLVTPVRDGLNLVAKEFVACRIDEDGVLVLSEFAGASGELAEAVHVHPFDIEGTAEQYRRALAMDRAERRVRMRGLRARVLSRDLPAWAAGFRAALADAHQANSGALRFSPRREVDAAVARLRSASRLELLLDYDGTLVPFAGTPELATPDAELLELLRNLSRRPRTHVHLVSGRPRENLERWFGPLPISLHAEHGYWSRGPGARWARLPVTAERWREEAERLLHDFAERTPGSLVEVKAVGFAWHYRMADAEFGARQANELRVHLAELFSNSPVEVLAGDKVIELRPHGVNKGVVAQRVVAQLRPETVIGALGDDATDEDLFAALPPEAETFHVGPRPSRARLRLEDVAAAREVLSALAIRTEATAVP